MLLYVLHSTYFRPCCRPSYWPVTLHSALYTVSKQATATCIVSYVLDKKKSYCKGESYNNNCYACGFCGIYCLLSSSGMQLIF